jgi:hypothetical protein
MPTNHAQDRFFKRYNRKIEWEQMQAMEQMIEQNQVRSRITVQGGRQRVALCIGDETYHCICCAVTHVIITFVDPDECKHQKKKRKFSQNGNRRQKRR